jgi:serine/threonine protein phosphatase PrpC
LSTSGCPLCAKSRHSPASFDHLVGNSEQRRRDRDTEPVCRLEVDDHLELGRLLDRDIGDFRAFEDKIDNLCATLPLRAVICPVGLVTASLLKQAVLCSNPQITL